MSIASAKMPVAVVSGAICLLLGVAGGIVIASFVDTGLNKQASGGEPAELKDVGGGKAAMPPGGGMPGGAKGGGGGAKGGGGGAKGGGPKGPNSKQQLTQLVVKLESLSKKPLAVELTPEQKKEVKSLLADLDSKDALSEEEAKAKFDQLIKLLESQRATLEAAGYRWPGTPFLPPAETPLNPFKDGEPAAKLNSLRESIGK
jgi:hypothetical protein